MARYIKRLKDILRPYKFRLFAYLFKCYRPFEWRKLKKDKDSLRGEGGLLVIPCDAWSLTGSRGDEAMLLVLQERFPNMSYHIVTATPEASAAALRHGWIPEHVWTYKLLFTSIMSAVKRIRPSACTVLGADVMDGYYNPDLSIALLALSDIIAHHGIPTSLLGYSFNTRPHPKVIKALHGMDDSFSYQLRDPVSLQRFEKATGKQGKLVADVAFLLKPDRDSAQYKELFSWKQKEGNPLLIVNLHPMLIKNATSDQIDKMISILSQILASLLDTTNWNILLLPHDDRPQVNDNICLVPLFLKTKKWKNRVRHVPEVLSAAKLKGIVSLGDALVMSRMHLGIAGLSQGVPTMGFAYQDKFQGMVQHLGLNEEFILPLPFDENKQEILNRIKWMLERKDNIRMILTSRLPKVYELAKKNFEVFQ